MYDPRWNQDDQCAEVVKNGWAIDQGGSPGHKLVSKLKKVKYGLIG